MNSQSVRIPRWRTDTSITGHVLLALGVRFRLNMDSSIRIATCSSKLLLLLFGESVAWKITLRLFEAISAKHRFDWSTSYAHMGSAESKFRLCTDC